MMCPAYFDTGFSVREPMWHGGGNILDNYPENWAEARILAGLEWEPELRPAFGLVELDAEQIRQLTKIGDDDVMRDAWIIEHFGEGSRYVPPSRTPDLLLPPSIAVRESNVQRVIRNDTLATLGHVSDQFSLILHSEMGDILEAILGLENVKFETAGSLKGGATVWALAYIDEPINVAKDDTATYPFVVLLNKHDGSGACKLISTNVRVVCWNTANAAEMQGEKTGRQFTFRHVGDVKSRIEEAMKAIAGVRDEAQEWDALATELFGMKVDDAKLNHFLADFIPEPPADVISPRVRNNIDRARDVFKHLYLDSVTTAGHRGTGLGLVDASVEYLDHVRGFRNADTYLGRTLLRPEPLKAKAVMLVREHCG